MCNCARNIVFMIKLNALPLEAIEEGKRITAIPGKMLVPDFFALRLKKKLFFSTAFLVPFEHRHLLLMFLNTITYKQGGFQVSTMNKKISVPTQLPFCHLLLQIALDLSLSCCSITRRNAVENTDKLKGCPASHSRVIIEQSSSFSVYVCKRVALFLAKIKSVIIHTLFPFLRI